MTMLRGTVAQVQVDQALIRDACVFRHVFEVGNHVLIEPDGDGLFQFRRVRGRAGLHVGKIVFGSHDGSTFVESTLVPGCLAGVAVMSVPAAARPAHRGFPAAQV